MSTTPDSRLNTCGCETSQIPADNIVNRPGLPSLAYRLGVHPDFLRRMIDRLPTSPPAPTINGGPYPLSALGTRSSDDPSIAMLDAWAMVADVLSFYQERIANEGFLRTATERRSILELARTIGYELNPGVAASAFLTFTVEDAPGAPGIATVHQGIRVQSTPAQGKLPQTFETSEEIVARAEWNALRPRLTRPQELAIVPPAGGNEAMLYLLGTSTGFDETAESLDPSAVHPLDPSLSLPDDEVRAVKRSQLYLAGTTTNLSVGERLLLVGKKGGDEVAGRTLTALIRHVEPEPTLDRTRIDFVSEGTPPPTPFLPLQLQIGKIQIQPLSLTAYSVETVVRAGAWRERDLSAFLSVQGWSGRSLARYVNRKPNPPLPPPDAGVFAFTVESGPFGHNAPRWDSLPLTQRVPEDAEGVPYPDTWDGDNEPDITRPSRDGDDPYIDSYGVNFFAERSLPEVRTGGWVLLENPDGVSPYRVTATHDVSLADYALSAKATGIAVEKLEDSSDPGTFRIRRTTIHAGSRPLALAELPIEEPVFAGAMSLQLDSMVLGLGAGQAVAISGERDDLPGVTGREIAILDDIVHNGGFTTLFFVDGLTYPYVRKTMLLEANVVLSTHGETITEVLGGGDSTVANQEFALNRPPLTYVPASTSTGARSTLEIRVNGVRWDNESYLYGLEPSDERYIVRQEDDGKTRVIFGDGTQGARVPTGEENVTAVYRTGIGEPGMVSAGSLTLLQTRPLGVRGVTNPLPASGAEPPEGRDAARDNAPVTVLALGRIVSLQDFEDFARAFAGIGKSQALALWKGGTQFIHLSIAAASPPAAGEDEGGSPALATQVIDPGSPLQTNLLHAIETSRDPGELVIVTSYQPLFFNVRTKVLVDARYVRDTVFAAVEAALRDAFSFTNRAFGQAVTAAEVVTVIQGVEGVIAVDLDQLYRYEDDQAPPPQTAQVLPNPPLLPADRARWDETAGEIRLAELLLINPVGIIVEEMQS